MAEARAAANRPIPVPAMAAIALACLAQVTVAGYGGAQYHLSWLVWAAAFLLAASALVLLPLFRCACWPAHRPYLIVAAAVAVWLGVVQITSVGPQHTLPGSWMWWSALCLVPVARYCHEHQLGGWLLAALVVPAAGLAYWRAWEALWDPAGYLSAIVDPNLLADRIGILLILAAAGSAAFLTRLGAAPAASRIWVPVALAVATILGAFLIQQGLQARAVMAMLVLGLAMVVVASRWRSGWWLPVLPVIVFALPWLFPDWAQVRGGDAVGLDRFGATALDRASFARFEIWRGAVALMSPATLLSGAGIGAFALLYPSVRGAADRTFGNLVHNDWLQLLLEGGLPLFGALVAVAVLCAIAWWQFGRILFRASAGAAGRAPLIMGFGTLTCVGWILGHAFINFTLYDPALLYIFVVCVVLGISVWRDRFGAGTRAGSTEATASRPVRFGAGAVMVMLVAFWVPAGGYALTVVALADRSPFPGLSPPELEPAAHYDMAARLRRWGVGYGIPAFVQASWTAEIWRAQNENGQPDLVEVAVRGFAEAVERSPWLMDHYLGYARFLEETGMVPVEVRVAILEEARRRNPFDVQVWLELAGQRQRAGAWQAVAADQGASWLATCEYAAFRDRDGARAMFGILPEAALARESELAARCRELLERPATRQTRLR